MTPNKEDFLKAIYRLGGETQMVSNKQFAEELKITPASVTEMLIKLDSEKLVDYTPYKGSLMTPDGMEKTLSLVRGHRLWEVFLKEKLGYTWSEAHEEAHLLEHISSDRLVERLDEFLGNPEHCPHGNTIPRQSGKIVGRSLITLEKLKVGDRSFVRRVVEKKQLLDYLQKLGVEIETDIEVISIGDYEGEITVLLKGKEIQISYKAACQIFVDDIRHKQ